MNTDDNNSEKHDKKRVLKKVRTQFLSRRPEQELNQLIVVPKLRNPHKAHIIDVSAGLIEKNRKISINIHNSSPNLIIDEISTHNWLRSKIVTLSFDQNKGYNTLPWEYSVERLESYGDLELATWAHKIRGYYTNYPKVMQKYFDKIHSEDFSTDNMQKAVLEARNFEREVAEKYPYKKFTYLYRKEAKKLVSVTFNESIIQQAGQSIQEFIDWTKQHGVPTFFDGDSKLALAIGKNYLDLLLSSIEGIHEGALVSTFMFDIYGRRRKVITQHVRVFEPSSEGLYVSTYAIVKSIEPYEDFNERVNQEQEHDGQERKYMKEDGTVEMEIPNNTD